VRSQHPTDVLERENEAYRRFLDHKDRRVEIAKNLRLRCKHCRYFRWGLWYYCLLRGLGRTAQVKPGQFACKNFIARAKREDEAL